MRRTTGPAASAPTTEGVGIVFGYAGRPLEARTGLSDNRARWYEPGSGKFINEDPSGFKGGDANLYRYVGNDPLDQVDPSGLAASWAKNLGSGFSGSSSSGSSSSSSIFSNDWSFGLGGASGYGGSSLASSIGASSGSAPPSSWANFASPVFVGGSPMPSSIRSSPEVSWWDPSSGGLVGLGKELQDTGVLRGEYVKKASLLSPTDVAGREALKLEYRAKQTALGKAITEEILASRAGQSSSLSNAAKTNPGVNAAGSIMKYGGRALVVAGVGVEAYNVVNAPEGERGKAAVQAGGRLAGGLAGSWVGAQWGIAGGPWGVAAGALLGGVVGAVGGEAFVNSVLRW